jgi:hypothetical protein
MAQFKKYAPFILAAVALVTLYLNYDQWRMMKKEDCNCGEAEQVLGAIN